MALVEDKNELLNQLKITDDDLEPKALKTVHLLIASTLSAIIAGVIVYLLLSPGQEDMPTGSDTNPTEGSPLSETVGAIKSTRSQTIDDKPAITKTFQFSNSNEILNASGYISARRIATVSAEIMGLITSVKVEEGMNVKTGQILATLDHSVASVNLKLATARTDVLESRIKSTEIDLQEASRVLTRIKELDKASYSSQAQITRAQTDVDKFRSELVSAQADIRVARLQVEQQQEILDNHTIRAPFSGVVTVKNAQTGEIVSPSSAGGGFTRTGICTIVDMTSLEIEVDVNEAFIGRVFDGQLVKANLDAYPDWDIPASVIAIIPTADRAKATVRVRIKIEQKDIRILPDMGVKVAFLKDK